MKVNNRVCVFINGKLTPVNDEEDILKFVTARPKKIGDDVIVLFKTTTLPIEKKVRYLQSCHYVKDSTFLVDMANNEAWNYIIKEE